MLLGGKVAYSFPIKGSCKANNRTTPHTLPTLTQGNENIQIWFYNLVYNCTSLSRCAQWCSCCFFPKDSSEMKEVISALATPFMLMYCCGSFLVSKCIGRSRGIKRSGCRSRKSRPGRDKARVPCRTQNNPAATDRAMSQPFVEEIPDFLPVRQRALTPPLTKAATIFPSENSGQRTDNQLQSELFACIPVEVRQMIFRYVLSSYLHLHIFRRTDKRLGHYKCHSTHRHITDVVIRRSIGTEAGFCTDLGSSHRAVSPSGAWKPGTRKDDQLMELLSLLMICRKA